MMSMMFVFLNMVLVQLMFYSTHPISLGLFLIILSLFSGMMVMKMNISWFFYLLVLVFLGGVMVLIIYMSTLAANEKFSFKMSGLVNTIMLALSGSLLFVMGMKSITGKMSMGVMVAGSMYECVNMSSLVFLMFYLFLTMVCVVKLVKFESGPLIKRL
uniref:NADH dehydrogenase subunit 6 n=1 Tax=Calanus hyperboreus TaxID=114069 RepID=K7QLF5_CALHY|nr:NADH dehydrogenase subunit 6 [Calanus hyperboreus]AFU88799.1 NADH dehydrogenase subunit 6 [Calanus hyperboreus]